MNDKITIADLIEKKQRGEKIVAVSCYDYTTAALAALAHVDMILVGDSAAQIVLGHDSTLPATMDFMVELTAGVRRGAPNLCLAADMPFLAGQLGKYQAVKNAGRFAAEAGAQIIKIEANTAYLDVIKAISDAGMAVMAHIGIRPQSILKKGRFKAKATTAEMALELINLADRMVYAGAGMLLLEGTASEVAHIIARRSDVPVISCGSGSGCDGQILIAPDILGLTRDKTPKFAKSYEDLGSKTIDAFNAYSSEIRNQKFPDSAHSYHMKKGQLDRLTNLLDSQTP